MATSSIASMGIQTYKIHLEKTKITASDDTPGNAKQWYEFVIDFMSEILLKKKKRHHPLSFFISIRLPFLVFPSSSNPWKSSTAFYSSWNTRPPHHAHPSVPLAKESLIKKKKNCPNFCFSYRFLGGYWQFFIYFLLASERTLTIFYTLFHVRFYFYLSQLFRVVNCVFLARFSSSFSLIF